jgi:hypothetical protein
MKHIITHAQTGKTDISAYIDRYLFNLPSHPDTIYLEASLLEDLSWILTASFDGETLWLSNNIWGRVYVKKLSDELQVLA